MAPKVVFAVARPKSMLARRVCRGTRPSRSHSRRGGPGPRHPAPAQNPAPPAPQSPAGINRDALGAGAHRAQDRLLHGALVADAALDLGGDVLSHKLSVELR